MGTNKVFVNIFIGVYSFTIRLSRLKKKLHEFYSYLSLILFITFFFAVGNYSQLIINFYLGRQISYYVIQTYIPSSIIVVVSWVSFWIPRKATPARVALGVTTVLTMTTIMGNAGSSLPKLSYMKAIDIFLGKLYFRVKKITVCANQQIHSLTKKIEQMSRIAFLVGGIFLLARVQGPLRMEVQGKAY